MRCVAQMMIASMAASLVLQVALVLGLAPTLTFPTPFGHRHHSEQLNRHSSAALQAHEESEVEEIKNTTDGTGDDGDEEFGLSKKRIVASTSIDLPFSADIAFAAFSDLPRQPSWSSWLHSVSYIDEIDDEDKGQGAGIIKYSECGIPLRQTKWVMKWKKLSFSWNSRVTKISRPNLIQWESTSGLKNMGSISFTENNNAADESSTMVLTITFVAPRIVCSVLRRSDRIASLMEDKMLKPTLVNFRDTVITKDLGLDANLLK